MTLWQHSRLPDDVTTEALEIGDVKDLHTFAPDNLSDPMEDNTSLDLGAASIVLSNWSPDHFASGSSADGDDEAVDWTTDIRQESRSSSTSVGLSTVIGARSSTVSSSMGPAEPVCADDSLRGAGPFVGGHSAAMACDRPAAAVSTTASSGPDRSSSRAGSTSKSSLSIGSDSAVDIGSELQDDPHTGVVLHESIVPCKLEILYSLFFGKNPRFFTVMCTKRGGSSIVVRPWATPVGVNYAERTMEYTLALNYSIGPKSAKTYEVHRRIFKEKGVKYVTETDCRTPEVPYGQNFFTRHRFCMTAHGLNEAYLKVSAEVIYVKPCWSMTRAFIEKFVYDGVKMYWKDAPFTMLELVEAEAVEANSMASAGSSGLGEPGVAPRLRRSVSIESLQSIVSATQTKQSEEAMVEALSRSPFWLICAGLLVILVLNNIALHYRFNGLQVQMTEMMAALNGIKVATDQAALADSYCSGSNAPL